MSDPDTTLTRMLDWLDGRLPAAEAERTAAEVARDAEAARLLGLYRSARAAARADDSEAPPPALLARLRAIGAAAASSAPASASASASAAPRPPLADRVAARVRAWLDELAEVPRGVAALVHDSQAAQPGLRGGAATAEPRLLAFADEVVEVELQLAAAGDGARVLGQVSRLDGAAIDGAEVRFAGLDEREGMELVLVADASGMVAGRLEPGAWSAVAVLPDHVLVIERLMVDGGDAGAGAG